MAQTMPRNRRLSNSSAATAERDVYLCPVCQEVQRSTGWLKWHVCNKHCPYKGDFSRTLASDPDKYVKGKYGHMVRR